MRAVTRRNFTIGLGAMGLAGCIGGGGGIASGPSAPDPTMRAVANPGWDAWVQGFRGRALARGVAAGTFDTAFRSAGFLPGVIEKDRNQTEFKRSLEDYLAIAASDERISKGRLALSQYGGVLGQIEARYGVEARVVCAIWGLESRYGERRGDVPLISALSTLAYDGRRGEFFESQLVAALKILGNGDISPGAMTGSWAGAMGHTQFIPTTYLAYAVDFTGDGRRDIWSNDPTDALASAANYLAKSGWTHGQPWGIEVQKPAGLAAPGRGVIRSIGDWSAAGVRTATGGALPNHGPAALLAPMGSGGPAFLVFRNFNVILRYNNAENYAIGVGHLSDRLAGAGPVRASFPPDAQGMTMADRQDLQRRLTSAGYDTGGSDGVIGQKTRDAISAWQRANGMAVTGEPSLEILRRMR